MNANESIRKDACIGLTAAKDYCESLAAQCDEQQERFEADSLTPGNRAKSTLSVEGQSVDSYKACLEKARDLSSEKETPKREDRVSLLNRDLTLNVSGFSYVNADKGQISFQNPQPSLKLGFPVWTPVFGRPLKSNSEFSVDSSGNVRGEALGLRWLHELGDRVYLQPTVSLLSNNDRFERTGYDIVRGGFDLSFQLFGRDLSDTVSMPIRYVDYLNGFVGSEVGLSEFPDGQSSVNCSSDDSACGRLPHITTNARVGIDGAWHTGKWEFRGVGKVNYEMAPNAAVNSLNLSVYRRISQTLALGLDVGCQYLKKLGNPMTGYAPIQDGGKCFGGLGLTWNPLVGKVKTYETAEEWQSVVDAKEEAAREEASAQEKDALPDVNETDGDLDVGPQDF